uniref:Uncharacterized protein n=1 Tax=Arundo donax TaxID=35708 RepID=A0A0A9BDE2_ARUDO
MGRKGDIVGGAYLGLIVVGYVVKFLSLSPDADRARFWGSVCSVVMALFCVATAAIIGIFIRDYMNVDGVYVVKYDPPQPAAPAAAEQIPPPPPEMDIC